MNLNAHLLYLEDRKKRQTHIASLSTLILFLIQKYSRIK